MLELRGLSEFNQQVQQWFDAVQVETARASVGLAKSLFKQLLQGSPQFSGDFAANWKVEYGSITPSFDEDVVAVQKITDKGFRIEPFTRGSSPAIRYAESMAKWRPMRLGESIYLHNSAMHLDDFNNPDYYGWKIENGEIKFRPGNRGADAVMRRSLIHVSNRYAVINKAQLATLSRFGV